MIPTFTCWLSRPNEVNVAHIVARSRAIGPGNRFGLWGQGCPQRCPGCINPGMQPFQERSWLSVEKLTAIILAAKDINGLTISGGEPFVQAEALYKVCREVRSEGLDVVVFTGFTLEHLRAGQVPYAEDLLRETDLLVDGPYLRDLPSNRPWRGSENQRLIALSDRYREQVSQWNAPKGQPFEIRLSEQGHVEVIGLPPTELLEHGNTVFDETPEACFDGPGTPPRGNGASICGPLETVIGEEQLNSERDKEA